MDDGFDREVALQARRRAEQLHAMGYLAAAGELTAMANVLDEIGQHVLRAGARGSWSLCDADEVESAA